MIRDFKREDIYNIEFNQYANIKANSKTLEQYADSLLRFNAWTLVHNGKIQCILTADEFFDGIYTAGILFSKDFELVCAREVKKFIHNYVIPHFNIRRLETDSIDCDVLNRWHDFLGFTSEGVKRKYLNGNDYRIWSIV